MLPSPPQSVSPKGDMLFQYHVRMQKTGVSAQAGLGERHQPPVRVEQLASPRDGHALVSLDVRRPDEPSARGQRRALDGQRDGRQGGQQVGQRDDPRRGLGGVLVQYVESDGLIEREVTASRSYQAREMRPGAEPFPERIRERPHVVTRRADEADPAAGFPAIR